MVQAKRRVGTEFFPNDPRFPPYSARYAFTLDLFNSKEVPVGLRNFRLDFECEGGVVSSIPQAPETARKISSGLTEYDPVSTLNLPPRQFVSQQFKGDFGGEDVEKLTGWKIARLVAEYPDGKRKTFNEVIAERQGEQLSFHS